jgi:hypothetical protein
MIYPLIVGLTMFVLPIGSIWIDSGHSDLLWLVGKWFVFWGVGVRLLLAGLRQYLQPAFTSRDIMGIESPDAFILVRELGGANVASGLVGLASIAIPTFVLPSAISSAIFCAFAAIEHIKAKDRGTNEVIAMISDIFISLVLVCFAIGALVRGLR